jgi:hypothetical protein
MTMVQTQAPAQDFHQQAAALRPETRMVIDGKLADARSGRRFETVNPANDETLASVPLGVAEDVDLAVASARAVFKAGSLVPDGTARSYAGDVSNGRSDHGKCAPPGAHGFAECRETDRRRAESEWRGCCRSLDFPVFRRSHR